MATRTIGLTVEELNALLDAMGNMEAELDEIEEHNPELASAYRKLVAAVNRRGRR
jgi:hypothetical protein